MADGDEKIDTNDRVPVLNRVADATTESKFNGVTLVWRPREIRSIQRDEADHHIRQTKVKADPMGSYYMISRLVILDEEGHALDAAAGASTEPLTDAECKELAKYGSLDTTHLPPDRLIGGQMLMDPETGEYPGKVILKGAPRGGSMVGTAPPPRQDRATTDAELDTL